MGGAVKNVMLTLGAAHKGGPAFAAHERAVKALSKEYNRLSRSNKSMMRGMTANRRIIQQVGMQVSDFSVQIAGGQSAILAFTQNVPQVVQWFGALGGILAGLITILGTMVFMLSKTGASFEDMAKKVGLADEQIQMISSAFSAIKNVFLDSVNFAVNHLDVLLYSLAAVGTYMATKWVASFIWAGKSVGFLVGTLKALKSILLSLGFYAIIAAVGLLIERIMALQSVTKDWGKTFSLVGRAVGEVVMNLPKLVLAMSGKIVKYGFLAASGLIEMFQNITSPVRGVVNSIVGFFVAAFKLIATTFMNLPVIIGNAVVESTNMIIQSLEDVINAIATFNNKIAKKLDPTRGFAQLTVLPKVDNPWKDQASELGDALRGEIADAVNFDYVGKGLDGIQDNLRGAANAADVLGNSMWEAAMKNMPAWKEINELLGGLDDKKFDIRTLFPDTSSAAETAKTDLEKLTKAGKESAEAVTEAGKSVFDFFKKIPGAVGDAAEKSAERVKRFGKDAAKPFEDMWEAAGDAVEGIKKAADGITSAMKNSFKELIKGTKSFKDAMLDMLSEIFDRLLDLVFDPYFNAIAGGINKGLGGIFKPGGVMGTPTVPSFDGGGNTWRGPRAGGVDGKGGRFALLHPNETVFDHVKNTGGYGGVSKSVVIYTTNNFNGVTREEVMADVAESQRAMKKQIDAEFPSRARKHQFNLRRGMT